MLINCTLASKAKREVAIFLNLFILFSDEQEGGGQNVDDDDSSSNSDTDFYQIGSGSNNKKKFINKIALLVSKTLQPPLATTEWQNYNLNPPNVSTLAIPNSTPAFKFDNVLNNDKSDKFDHKRLLKFVPSNFRGKAKQLLEKIDENPEQLTFSTDGVIYINKVSIPDSDIFHLFPYLFKAKHPKNLEGFQDFINQIHELGLSHLIKSPVLKSSISKRQATEIDNPSTPNWWYLGP